jgi:hypothetical protein
VDLDVDDKGRPVPATKPQRGKVTKFAEDAADSGTASKTMTKKTKLAYDPSSRDPLHAAADKGCGWESVLLLSHFHPSIGHFTESLMSHTSTEVVVCVMVCVCVCVCVCVTVCLSVCLFIALSFCLYICLSVCPCDSVYVFVSASCRVCPLTRMSQAQDIGEIRFRTSR